METMGAPQSSTAARHCSTLSVSLMVDLYSRIRPQPVQVRLQACRGSSIRTMGSLRWRARSLPLQFGVVVGSDRFAKATILILHGAKPGDSALAIVAGAEGNGFQRAQHAACAIDIIDAPASIPRAIR